MNQRYQSRTNENVRVRKILNTNNHSITIIDKQREIFSLRINYFIIFLKFYHA